jgi:phosphate transport system permease protein
MEITLPDHGLPTKDLIAEVPRQAGPVDDVPRRTSERTADDVMALVGSAAGSLAVVWILYEGLLPFSGVLGFLVCWFVGFLAMYAGVTALSHPRPIVMDRLAASVIYVFAGVVGFALASTVFYTVFKGWPALHHFNFFTKDMAGVGPQDPLTHGGIQHALVGSLIELGIATAVALPLGIGTAIFITEVGGRFSKFVRTVIEAMTALPDILAGLFVYTTLIVHLGVGRTGFAAACALSIMMTPIIARGADVALRVVPGGLREAGMALGASHWQTVWRVVLPTARPGLATSLILGLARAVGETAPVLIASGASTFLNYHPLRDPMNSLPLFAYAAIRSGEPTYIQRGFGDASVLLGLVLILFIVTRLLARTRTARS